MQPFTPAAAAPPDQRAARPVKRAAPPVKRAAPPVKRAAPSVKRAAPSAQPSAPSAQRSAPLRRRHRKESPPAPPLGSLTQLQSRAVCTSCGSSRVTHVGMNLTDGTPVVFTSCHRCEVRIWEHDGQPISVTDVLERTRKPA